MIDIFNALAKLVYSLPNHEITLKNPIDGERCYYIPWYGGTQRKVAEKVGITKLKAEFGIVPLSGGCVSLDVTAVCDDGENRDVYFDMYDKIDSIYSSVKMEIKE